MTIKFEKITTNGICLRTALAGPEEREHPDYLAITQKNISLFEEIIQYCQMKGQISEGNVEIVAIKLWSSVHGFVNLVIEDQFPADYLHDKKIKDLLKAIIV